MKKIILALLVLIIASTVCYAMGGSAPVKKASYAYLIDNFEDGNYDKTPEWFTFDSIMPSIVRTSTLRGGDAAVEANLKTYALSLKGTARDWYVGGLGTVLGIDASGYDSFEMDVYGNGETSGILKVELYDDDNGNSDIEVDKNWKPMYDDLWSYEQKVDWTGWKHISVPFTMFKNSGKGNGVFDPNLKGGSAGLVKVQLICVANSQTGSVDYSLANLELGVSSK